MIPEKKPKKVVGWWEWISLPLFGVERIKVKVDTGAKTSALHVSEMQYERRGKKEFIRFKLHPLQKLNKPEIEVLAELLEYRAVKSSVGTLTIRPVVVTTMLIDGEKIEAQITLVNRDMMGFRMLLGRQALKGRFVVDPQKRGILKKSFPNAASSTTETNSSSLNPVKTLKKKYKVKKKTPTVQNK